MIVLRKVIADALFCLTFSLVGCATPFVAPPHWLATEYHFQPEGTANVSGTPTAHQCAYRPDFCHEARNVGKQPFLPDPFLDDSGNHCDR
jgi:hypothetical protein